MVTKHTPPKDTVAPPKDTVVPPNDTVTPPKDTVAPPNDTVDTTCMLCERVFSRKYILTNHMKKCTGPKCALECDYCHKIFAHRSNKYAHIRICTLKKEKEAQALVVFQQQDPAGTTQVPTVQPLITNTNIQNLNGDNVQIQNQHNNTVINLVVYHNNASEGMQFDSSHIDAKEIKKLFVQKDKVPFDQLEPYAKIMRLYTHQLLSKNENKCVKKTNIRSAHSQVHVGNNTWESRLDKEVYPNLMNNIANDFSDFFSEKYSRKVQDMYKSVLAFIDYMASDGYCSSDTEHKVENLFKTFVKELKLHVFDGTKKDALKPSSSQIQQIA
jgi:hypothetical protein